MKFGLEVAHQQRQIRFTVSAPTSIQFDTWFKFDVAAVDDATGAVVPYYNGVALFTTNGGGGSITGSASLTNGVGQFDCYFHNGGTWKISAVDSVDTSIKGQSGGIFVGVIIPGSVAFTSTQWWTVPVGFNPANNYCDAYGSGGGGGGGYSTPPYGGGGGGGGGFARTSTLDFTTGQQVLVVVAAGGAAGANPTAVNFNGTPGGAGSHSGMMNEAQNAWFILAYGGGGGGGGNGAANSGGGGGGAGANGNALNFTGGTGAIGTVTDYPGANAHGGGCAGPSGNGSGETGGGGYGGNGSPGDGSAGGAYGGGGQGGAGYESRIPTAGGQGIVYIWWGA